MEGYVSRTTLKQQQKLIKTTIKLVITILFKILVFFLCCKILFIGNIKQKCLPYIFIPLTQLLMLTIHIHSYRFTQNRSLYPPLTAAQKTSWQAAQTSPSMRNLNYFHVICFYFLILNVFHHVKSPWMQIYLEMGQCQRSNLTPSMWFNSHLSIDHYLCFNSSFTEGKI